MSAPTTVVESVHYLCSLSTDKIKVMLKPGALSSMTRLVLVNAVYFKAQWISEFHEADTREQTFQVNEVRELQCLKILHLSHKNILLKSVWKIHCLQQLHNCNQPPPIVQAIKLVDIQS